MLNFAQPVRSPRTLLHLQRSYNPIQWRRLNFVSFWTGESGRLSVLLATVHTLVLQWSVELSLPIGETRVTQRVLRAE
jgi:hypothetical protein